MVLCTRTAAGADPRNSVTERIVDSNALWSVPRTADFHNEKRESVAGVDSAGRGQSYGVL